MPVSPEALELANKVRSFLSDHPVDSSRLHPYISVLLLCLPGEPRAGDYPSDWVIDKPLLKDEILRLLKLTEDLRHTREFRNQLKHTREKNTPKKINLFYKGREKQKDQTVSADSTLSEWTSPSESELYENTSILRTPSPQVATFDGSTVLTSRVELLPSAPITAVRSRDVEVAAIPIRPFQEACEEMPNMSQASEETSGETSRQTAIRTSNARNTSNWITQEQLDNAISPLSDSVQRIERLLNGLIVAQTHLPSPRPPTGGNTPNPVAGPPTASNSGSPRKKDKPEFRAKDIGYFDPKDTGPMVEVRDKVQVYHNVFSFTNRLKVKAQFVNVRKMREQLDECLLGQADTWYNQELNHLQRMGLRVGDGIKEWCDALEARFRQPPGQSLRQLEAVHYTLSDVYDRKDPLDFVQKVVVHGINSGIAKTEQQQAQLAYNHIDVRLRMTLAEPKGSTTLSEFIEQINQRKHDWFDRYKRREARDTRGNNPRRQYSLSSYKRNRDGRDDRVDRDESRYRKDRNDRKPTGITNDKDEHRHYGRNEPPYRESNRNSTQPQRYDEKQKSDRYTSERREGRPRVYQAETDREEHENTEEDNTDTEPEETSTDEVEANTVQVISSDAPEATHSGRDYRRWYFARVNIKLKLDDPPTPVCYDTGCAMSLVDKTFLKTTIDIEIKKLPAPILVKGIGAKRQPSSDYVLLDLYIDGKATDGKNVTVHIRREFHIVDNLGPLMLIGMDIIGPEGIDCSIVRKELTFTRHKNTTTSIMVDPPELFRMQRKVQSLKRIIVPAHTITTMPIKLRSKQSLDNNKSYIFTPSYNGATEALLNKGGIYNHLVDSNFSFVNVRNDSNTDVIIPRHTFIGYIESFQELECYPIDPESHDLAAYMDDGSSIQDNTETTPNSLTKIDNNQYKTDLGITIYAETEEHLRCLHDLLQDFRPLFQEKPGLAQTDQLLKIPLIDGWERCKIPTKVYPLSAKDRTIVDELFDNLHQKNKMIWSDRPSPFGFPVFVTWRNVYDAKTSQTTRKPRVVVDIRGLNKLAVPDSYPLPRQEDIINATKGAKYITVSDASLFFYQWGVHPEDQWKFAVNTHRGQEFFTVAIMGFRNSPPYVQRQVERMLGQERMEYVKVYIDDFATWSITFEEHLSRLRDIYSLLLSRNITLNPKKTFVAFPNVTLLGQHVDGLGITTLEDRVKAITSIKMPTTLKQLEHWLGMVGYLRSKIEKHAQLIDPLARRKTMLLRGSPTKGTKRKIFATRTPFEPTAEEREVFDETKSRIKSLVAAVHFDSEGQLYVDIDAAKNGFGVMVYHSRKDVSGNIPPNRIDVEPIMFLSKLLSKAESRYWPTELEVACLVWTVRKIRHMIEGCTKTPIVYTDHAATAGIVNHTHLGSSAVDKLNLRLIRASQYLSQFQLDIRHRPGTSNIVADSLSRLHSTAEASKDSNILDEVASVFHASVLQISDVFKKAIRTGYQEDPAYRKILQAITEGKELFHFQLYDDLLYFGKPHATRLCIPQNVQQNIFELAHDRQGHIGFHRLYHALVSQYHIRGLTRKLKDYLKYCPRCLTHQTKRHLPYGKLMPLPIPEAPLEIIAIDFIVGLPTTPEGYNACMTMTDRLTKRIGLLAGKDIDSAEVWAERLIRFWSIASWGFPFGIISDRDPKFVSSFWRRLFKETATDLLFTTAWHPQADGQSERTNQAIEIAIRFLADDERYTDWSQMLPAITRIFNSTVSTVTGKTPDELLFGFNPWMRNTIAADTEANRLVFLKDAKDASQYAQDVMALRYDNKHKPLALHEGEKVFINLHKGYNINSKLHKKFGARRVGRFPIKRIFADGNAYELALPRHWKIHPVISVEHIEPVPKGKDPYSRPTDDGKDVEPVIQEGDTEEWKSWEIEKLVDKRTIRYGKGKSETEYLVQWKGFGPAYNEWYPVRLLQNAKELMAEYDAEHPKTRSQRR